MLLMMTCVCTQMREMRICAYKYAQPERASHFTNNNKYRKICLLRCNIEKDGGREGSGRF